MRGEPVSISEATFLSSWRAVIENHINGDIAALVRRTVRGAQQGLVVERHEMLSITPETEVLFRITARRTRKNLCRAIFVNFPCVVLKRVPLLKVRDSYEAFDCTYLHFVRSLFPMKPARLGRRVQGCSPTDDASLWSASRFSGRALPASFDDDPVR